MGDGVLLTSHALWFAAGAATCAGLGVWRARWGLAVLLAILPLFTHHPSADRVLWLSVLVGTFQLAYVVRARPTPARVWRALAEQPLLLVATLFAAAAVFSLTSLPLGGLWSEHVATAGVSPQGTWPRRALELARLTEERAEFSIKSVMLTLQGLVLAIIVWRETRTNSAAALALGTALASGLFVLCVFGLAEGFGIVDLTPLRGDRFVAYREGAVQAWAGNPGWFSQYVVYALPYVLAVPAADLPGRLKPLALTVVLAPVAFALVLAFQRGGWLFGALAIVYVAVSFPVVLGDASGRVPQRATGAAIAMVAAVGVAVSGALWLWTQSAAPGAPHLDMASLVRRLTSIAGADRLIFVTVGSMIVGLHPILGGGHESFATRYLQYFETPGGPFEHSAVRAPSIAAAHNLYVQTATGTGWVGLVLLLSIFTVAAWSAVRTLRSAAVDRDRRVVLLASAGSLAGIAGYGLVQEVYYIHALRLLFYVAVGLLAGAAREGPALAPRAAQGMWLALLGALVLHLGYEYVWPGTSRLLTSPGATGVYAEELESADMPFRWTTSWATWPVRPGATRFSLRVRSIAPFDQALDIRGCRGERLHVPLPDHQWRTVEGALTRCGPGQRLELRVSPPWRPALYYRVMGVKVADLRIE